ncbi:DUF2384 domain-containing protein [Nisaea sp.]|uniref:DUF2384 domain-containing protein n=1 Tax=Nisaea sp. TaxID=2024842 RepID=UPI002B278F23|nr:DUF2384 domain-containing protein [Nisaea sp.]
MIDVPPLQDLPDLSDPAARQRLGPAALRAFYRMMQTWHISDVDADLLLVGIPADGRQLSEEQMLRISYLLGIWKALRMLFSGPLAEGWIQTENKGPLYNGATPLQFIISGGLPALEQVRLRLDSMTW